MTHDAYGFQRLNGPVLRICRYVLSNISLYIAKTKKCQKQKQKQMTHDAWWFPILDVPKLKLCPDVCVDHRKVFPVDCPTWEKKDHNEKEEKKRSQWKKQRQRSESCASCCSWSCYWWLICCIIFIFFHIFVDHREVFTVCTAPPRENQIITRIFSFSDNNGNLFFLKS